ncbi:unnamed protein product [Amoebophrya sp. A120]|nr:unnamed protein product [Amoebophrya sp. A120]|eukprot:GSA120T00022153001.1
MQTIVGFFRHFLQNVDPGYFEKWQAWVERGQGASEDGEPSIENEQETDEVELMIRDKKFQLLAEELEQQLLAMTTSNGNHTGGSESSELQEDHSQSVADVPSRLAPAPLRYDNPLEIEKVYHSILLRSPLLRKAMQQEKSLLEDLNRNRDYFFRLFHSLFSSSVVKPGLSNEGEKLLLKNPLLQYSFNYVKVNVKQAGKTQSERTGGGSREDHARRGPVTGYATGEVDGIFSAPDATVKVSRDESSPTGGGIREEDDQRSRGEHEDQQAGEARPEQDEKPPELQFTEEELFDRTCWLPCPTIDWEFLCHAFGICDNDDSGVAASASGEDVEDSSNHSSQQSSHKNQDKPPQEGPPQLPPSPLLRTELQKELIQAYNSWVIPDHGTRSVDFEVHGRGYGERYDAFADNWIAQERDRIDMLEKPTASSPGLTDGSSFDSSSALQDSSAAAASDRENDAKAPDNAESALAVLAPAHQASATATTYNSARSTKSVGKEEYASQDRVRNLEKARLEKEQLLKTRQDNVGSSTTNDPQEGKKPAKLVTKFTIEELMKLWEGEGEMFYGGSATSKDGKKSKKDNNNSIPDVFLREHKSYEIQELEAKKRAFRIMLSVGEVTRENNQEPNDPLEQVEASQSSAGTKSTRPKYERAEQVACQQDLGKLYLKYNWAIDEYYPDAKNHFYKVPMQTIYSETQPVTCVHPSLPDLKNLIVQNSPCRAYTWKKSWKKPLNRAYFKKQSCKFGRELKLLMPKAAEVLTRKNNWARGKVEEEIQYNDDGDHVKVDPTTTTTASKMLNAGVSYVNVSQELPFLNFENEPTIEKYWKSRPRNSLVPPHSHIPRNLTTTTVFEFLKSTLLPIVFSQDGNTVFLPRLEPAQLDTTIPGHQAS